MSLKRYHVNYGHGTQSVELEQERVLQVLQSNPVKPIADIRAAVLEAIRNPTGTEPLQKIVKPGDKICILVSDITRAWTKTSEYLPPVIEELNNTGIDDKDIFVIIAAGTHRNNTDGEVKTILGDDLASRLRVYPHDAYSEKENIYLGTTSRGTPVYINKRAVEADKVILTGGITPHLFAGFGGGRKSVMPGISGVKTINHNHVMALSDDNGGGINSETCLASIEGNRVNEDMCEVCSFLNPAFLINVIMDPYGNFSAVTAGHWYEAWHAGTEFVVRQQGVKAKGKSEIVITSGGGYPMDMNLYQGMKAFVPAKMLLKEKGVLIAVLECEDISEPPVFFQCFKYDDLLQMEMDVRSNFSIPFYVAFYVCDIARQYTVILVTKKENFSKVAKTGMLCTDNLEDAVDTAKKIIQAQGKGGYTYSIIPYGFNTIPLLEDK